MIQTPEPPAQGKEILHFRPSLRSPKGFQIIEYWLETDEFLQDKIKNELAQV